MGVMEDTTGIWYLPCDLWLWKKVFHLFYRVNQAVVSEMFSTQVYLANKTSVVLYFQMTTVLTLMWVEDWILGHGLLATIFFFPSKMVFLPYAKSFTFGSFTFKQCQATICGQRSLLYFLEIGGMLDCASMLPNWVSERTVKAMCQFY